MKSLGWRQHLPSNSRDMMLSIFNLSLSPIMNICSDQLPGVAALKTYIIWEKKRQTGTYGFHGTAQLTATVFVLGGMTGRVRDVDVSICRVWKTPDDQSLFSAGSRDKSSSGREKKDVCLRYRNNWKRTPPSVCRSEMA